MWLDARLTPLVANQVLAMWHAQDFVVSALADVADASSAPKSP